MTLSLERVRYFIILFSFPLQITQFCDNDTKDPSNLHVTEAPNKHNRLCDTRSSWEIMRQHPDFSGKVLLASFKAGH